MKWRTKMEQLPRTQFSQAFCEQSIKFFKKSGLTLVEATKRLSLPGGFKNWVCAGQQGELTTAGILRSIINNL
jgi:transposase